jgi:uncharacterized protein YcsI (UPF0317 family)
MMRPSMTTMPIASGQVSAPTTVVARNELRPNSAANANGNRAMTPNRIVMTPAYPSEMATGADVRVDLPRYRVLRDGHLVAEPTDITQWWRSDLVAFLLGCSFTFEWALASACLSDPVGRKPPPLPARSGSRCSPTRCSCS